MFAPRFGIPEDPATGSAAAAFAGVAQEFETPEDGVHAITIEQGFEMGRPSLIHLTMEVAGGKLISGEIGGSAVIVSQGTIEV
jgi:trans-2,3-dihydro-3-hydroxyanthranilate isomerase